MQVTGLKQVITKTHQNSLTAVCAVVVVTLDVI
jgi:hypothetical protein